MEERRWLPPRKDRRQSAPSSRGEEVPTLPANTCPMCQPTLLIVGALDTPVIEMNRQAMAQMRAEIRLVIAGASHLFEEPGTLEEVARLARDWFTRYLKPGSDERRA